MWMVFWGVDLCDVVNLRGGIEMLCRSVEREVIWIMRIMGMYGMIMKWGLVGKLKFYIMVRSNRRKRRKKKWVRNFLSCGWKNV